MGSAREHPIDADSECSADRPWVVRKVFVAVVEVESGGHTRPPSKAGNLDIGA